MARGDVTVNIIGDASKLRSALNESESALGRFAGKMQSTGRKITDIGAKMTLGITGPLALLGKASFDAASDLEQAIGATESVFGDATAAIDEFAKTSARSVGLSKRAYRELAAVAGAQFKNLGLSQADAAEQANELITIGADLAATFGGTTRDAVEALGAAFRGEADPAERFGLRLNINTANAKAVELGLADATSAVSDHARQQAIMALIVEQSGGAMGQFARETDSAAGRQQIMKARLEDLTATIGQKLLPIGIKLLEFVQKLIDRFSELSPTTQKFILIAAGLLAALGPLVTVVGALVTVIGFLISPVGLVIVGLAALTAGVVIAYQRFETFRNIVDTVIDVVSTLIRIYLTPLKTGIDLVAGAVRALIRWFGSLRDAASNLLGPLGSVLNTAGDIASTVGGAIGDVGSFVGGAISHIPGFAHGGVVPGPIGVPRLAVVHGGETVLPTHRSVGDTNIHISVTGSLQPDDIARELVWAVKTMGPR